MADLFTNELKHRTAQLLGCKPDEVVQQLGKLVNAAAMAQQFRIANKD